MASPSTSASAERRSHGRRLLLTALLLTSPLHAQSSASLAQTTFDEGRKAMKEGRLDAACSLFDESQRLDPSTGTLLNLALCEEARGRIATAATHLRGLLDSAAPQDARRPLAHRHLDALAPRLPRLILRAHREHDVASLQLTLDGVRLGLAAVGAELTIDPGAHLLVAALDGHEVRQSFTIAEKESLERWIDPESPVAPASAASPPLPASAASALPAAPPPSPPWSTSSRASPAPAPVGPSSRFAWRDHRLAWGLLGVGTAGLLVSATAGLIALREKQTVSDECPGGQCSTDRGLDAVERGKRAVLIGNIALVAGVVGVGVGAGLMLYQRPGGGVVAFHREW